MVKFTTNIKLKEMMHNPFDIGDIKWQTIITMSNAITGIMILAMPYCFAQCGIVLGTLTLILCGYFTSYSCRILLEAGEIKNTKTLEFLAFRTMGQSGKFFTEICVIFLLCGSMVAYQQTLGDSLPMIVSKLFGFKMTWTLRAFLMIVITLSVILPLCLAKKLDRLNRASAMAIAFYSIFAIYLLSWMIPMLNSGEWRGKIIYWRFSGLLQSIPIYSIAFSCQTVIFVFYSELPDASVKKMRKLIDTSLFLVFFIYFLGGLFGYIAFCNVRIHGNVLTSIPTTFISEIFVFGFVVCVLINFPFMVFPCRTSLNTLLFSELPKDNTEFDQRISESNFKKITIGIVFLSTLTAIVIPNMEWVLSVNGSTTGSLICYIIPALIYIKATGKSAKASPKSNILLWLGICLLFVCSMSNLYHVEDSSHIDSTPILGTEILGVKEKNILVNEINEEKVILKEQKKLLDMLKQRIDKDEAAAAAPQPGNPQLNNDKISNTNDTQKLIDTIDLKNKELQNIIDEKIQDIVLDKKQVEKPGTEEQLKQKNANPEDKKEQES